MLYVWTLLFLLAWYLYTGERNDRHNGFCGKSDIIHITHALNGCSYFPFLELDADCQLGFPVIDLLVSLCVMCDMAYEHCMIKCDYNNN